MKKYIYICLVLVAALATACKSNEDVTYTRTAAQDAAGVYQGTWQQISSYTGDTTYVAGTITLSTIHDTVAYLTNVTICNDSAEWKTKTGQANVAHAGKSGDVVFNNDGANGMGASFGGRIYGDGRIIFSTALASKIIVIIDEKKYKKNVLIAYTFTGNKVQEN